MLQGLGALAVSGTIPAQAGAVEPPSTPHAKATYRAVVDAVIPRTPELSGELGAEHVPGGLDIGLDSLLIEFIDELLTIASVDSADVNGNLPLSEPIALLLDAAAGELIATGENEDPPSIDRVLDVLSVEDVVQATDLSDDPERALEQSLFASLSRADRLKAIGTIDDVEFDTAEFPGPAVELDGALVGQLLVGFTQLLYYGEWSGYDDPSKPPSERTFADDELQSWKQTGFPGIIDGVAALRGYWSKPGASLGAGSVWRTIERDGEGPIQLRESPGEFVDNEYETEGYEEPCSTDGAPATEGRLESRTLDLTEDDIAVGDSGERDGTTPVDSATGGAGRDDIEGIIDG